MSEQVEIEFKNLLTEKEFKRLLDKFHIQKEQFAVQKNYYFDTVNFDLKKKNCALRIREKNNHFELTLKQPLPTEGLLETTSILDPSMAAHLLREGCGPLSAEDKVAGKLIQLEIELKNIVHFGTLTTERAECHYQNGLLVLDKSSYFHIQDYEVEFEVDHYKEGQAVFKSLLEEANIPIRQTANKVQRFYNQMKRTT